MAKYRDKGLEAIIGIHYGGNRRNMSVEEEARILTPFKGRAEKGEIVEVREIAEAYQAAVGHKIGSAQIYFVLHRHGWRKVMLRSKHPKKASEEAIEASKNNSIRPGYCDCFHAQARYGRVFIYSSNSFETGMSRAFAIENRGWYCQELFGNGFELNPSLEKNLQKFQKGRTKPPSISSIQVKDG